MVSYIEQAIPTILGQISRSIDGTQRETYSDNVLGEEWNRLKAKIPGLSSTLPEKIDNFGEVMKNNSALSQFISPGYAKAKDDRPFLKELERLYKIEKDTDIIPTVVNGKLTYDGVDYFMTMDEYNKFKKTYGETIMMGYTDKNKIKYSGLPALITQKDYTSLKSDKEKTADKKKMNKITKLYDKAYAIAKERFLVSRGIEID
jgi:hypothetical protein